MDNLVLAASLVCVIAALVGGGLKAFGIEIPLLQSLPRQMGLALFGGVLLVVHFIFLNGAKPIVVPGIGPSVLNLCDSAPILNLNEICADGKDCDGRKDFVEIYNPVDLLVTLNCYAIG